MYSDEVHCYLSRGSYCVHLCGFIFLILIMLQCDRSHTLLSLGLLSVSLGLGNTCFCVFRARCCHWNQLFWQQEMPRARTAKATVGNWLKSQPMTLEDVPVRSILARLSQQGGCLRPEFSSKQAMIAYISWWKKHGSIQEPHPSWSKQDCCFQPLDFEVFWLYHNRWWKKQALLLDFRMLLYKGPREKNRCISDPLDRYYPDWRQPGWVT